MSETTRVPGRTRRQEQAAARREQLLSVALDTFAENGFRGSTVRDIARAAGITEGLIYHYFPSKSALLRAVIERNTMMPALMEIIAGLKGMPVREALLLISQRYFELLMANRKFAAMMHTDCHRDPEMAVAFQAIARPGLEAILGLLKEGIARGELRDHDPAVSLRLLHGAVAWFFLTQDLLSPPLPARDPVIVVQEMMELALRGLADPDR
jgi:AcrR family transcriptional regulator